MPLSDSVMIRCAKVGSVPGLPSRTSKRRTILDNVAFIATHAYLKPVIGKQNNINQKSMWVHSSNKSINQIKSNYILSIAVAN